MWGDRRKFLACLVAGATGAGAGWLAIMPGCRSGTVDPWQGTKKPRVLVSIVPLHCFAAHVAEPDAEVLCLLTTTGPHEFEASPLDARLLSTAQLFIVNGLGLEGGLDQLIYTSGNRSVRIVRTGEHIPQEQLIHVGETRHGDHVHPAGVDPHVWLGIDEAKKQVEAIRNALIDIDPAHEANYRQRTKDYLAELDKLKERGKKLQGLRLVTFHDSFRYFARSFGIEIVGAIRGVKGEESRQLAELRDKGVQAIAIEPQYPREAADNLARQLGRDKIRMVLLDPLETARGALRDYYVDKSYYIQKMQENIDNLLSVKQELS